MTAMTDAERDAAIIADWADTAANGTMPPELRLDMARLLHLARIGAKVVAADEATVERVARAIDPKAWQFIDTQSVMTPEHPAIVPTRRHQMTQARAALASVGE